MNEVAERDRRVHFKLEVIYFFVIGCNYPNSCAIPCCGIGDCRKIRDAGNFSGENNHMICSFF